MLSVVLRDSYLVPKYKERELHVSCCKAKIAVKENEVHEFWLRFDQSYLHNMSYPRQWNDKDDVWFKDQASQYLGCANTLLPYPSSLIYAMSRDPNLSFLVGRLLSMSYRNYSYNMGDAMDLACAIYMEAALRNPQFVELDTLIFVFKYACNRTHHTFQKYIFR